MHKCLYEAQRKSLILVPWGPPISAVNTEKFNGTLLKHEERSEIEEEPDVKVCC